MRLIWPAYLVLPLMNFLYPAFLWALTALAIPIIIHLFNFRQPKKVFFSNVRFLDSVNKKSSSKIRLKHLLALAARLLMIFFLVMAFAQPYLSENSAGLNTRQVYFYMDNSQSMSTPVLGNATAFDEAYSLVNQIVDLYPRETQYKLLTNDFAAFSNSLKSRDEIKELTTELTFSDKSRSLTEITSRMEIEQIGEDASDVFFISDFQRSTIGEYSSNFSADTLNNYRILPIPASGVTNLFVDTVYLEKPFLFNNEENKLLVTIRNGGEVDGLGILVKFFIADNQYSSATVDVVAGGATTLAFDLSGNFAPSNNCKITIEDYPVVFDNEHYFVLKLANRVDVVEIGNSSSSPFQAVFANGQLFRYQYFDVGNVDYSAAASAQLVIFNGINRFNSALEPLCAELLRKGLSMMIVPSSTPDSLSYSRVLQMPVELNSSAREAPLSTVDVTNPFFENIFEEIEGRYETPKGTALLSWPTRGIDLLEFRNGDAFLSSINIAQGSMYLLASPLSPDFSDFSRHALFVPVMYKIALSSASTGDQLSFSVDDGLISLKLDSLVYETVYQLKNETAELIPDQRIVNNRLILELQSDESSVGYYDIMQGEEKVSSIALNHNKRESLIGSLTNQELAVAYGGQGNVEVSEVISSEQYTQELRQQYDGKNLWKYALVLSLIFLLAEVLILRFL